MSEDNTEQQPDKQIPPYGRDERGLLVGVEYKFKKDGRVDWRAMIDPKYIVINRRMEEEVKKRYNGKSLPELNVSEVDDKYLLILLAGIREIAALRGYTKINPEVISATPTYCSVKTSIHWIPNFETGNKPVVYGDVAGATKENTEGLATIFLDAIAANRAFVRAVRNFLGIGIVGHDEVAEQGLLTETDAPPALDPTSPQAMLATHAEKAGMNFEKIKEFALKEEIKKKLDGNPEEWKSYVDVKGRNCMMLVDAINKSKK